ncbi:MULTISPECIES: helix-turn-helix domain-containing protein [Nostocales]|uniref:hypothetical protein n=1 Tax=Nostocales TaxID=1161 RepID=UPI0038B616E8
MQKKFHTMVRSRASVGNEFKRTTTTTKALRERLDLTQEELSRRLNLSFRTIGETGNWKKNSAIG